MMTLCKHWLFIFAAAFVTIACDDDNNNESQVVGVQLQSFTEITSLSAEEVSALVGEVESAYDISYGLTTFTPVKVYKVIYSQPSIYNGTSIDASGLAILPDMTSTTAFPIFSLQHGTIVNPEMAPSNFDLSYGGTAFGVIAASQGFIVSMADYEGYGVSVDAKHPYEHAKSLAISSYGMLWATKEMVKNNPHIQFNDDLFLAGYSEGGFATMAFHKYLEELGFSVTMSSPGAGAYDKTAFAEAIIDENAELTFLPNYMWVIDAYDDIYVINRPWDAYVSDADAQALNAENNPMNYYKLPINTNPQALFKPDFSAAIREKTDTVFLAALKDNDIHDWKPKSPITLYYGTADDYVYPLNSINAAAAISANGGDVTTVIYDGKNHSTAFPPYTRDVLKQFMALRN